jgi:hypothetical protein
MFTIFAFQESEFIPLLTALGNKVDSQKDEGVADSTDEENEGK